MVESPFASVRLRTAVGKRYKKVALRFPASEEDGRRRAVRTTNAVERLFREVRGSLPGPVPPVQRSIASRSFRDGIRPAHLSSPSTTRAGVAMIP